MFHTIKRVIEWSGKRRSRIYWGFLWSFLSAMFTAMPIIGAAYSINLMLEDQAGRIKLTPIYGFYLLVFMVTMVLGRFLFSYLRAVFQDSVGYEVTAEERIRTGEILKRVSLGFFDRHSTGELVGAVTTDLCFVEMFAMHMIDSVIGGYISAFAMVICLVFYSPPSAAIAVLGILFSALVLRLMGHFSNRNAPIHQQAQNDLIAAAFEYIKGVPVVKAYGQEGASTGSIRGAFSRHRRINVKIERQYVPCNVLHLMALKLASVAIPAVSALLAAAGGMPVGDFLMMAIFSFVIFGQVEKVNNATHVLQVIGPTLDKLDKIKQTEFIDEDGKDISLDHYAIEMREVDFYYGKNKVLDGVSFTVPQNTTTAIVGPSGSGKTTICNLIARFYDADSGCVTVGGVDVRRMNCDCLLRNISMVFQNVYLFHDTVLNNIRFGKPDAAMEDVIEAAKKARCHDFITTLPKGYETMVGEGGSSLSGGEKQRISIARAILKDAPVVILDEATASVDPENEHFVQAAISELTRGKTMIVIAHRLATIENADQILVLEEGHIVQKGTHDLLSAQDGLYRRFIAIREQAESWSI